MYYRHDINLGGGMASPSKFHDLSGLTIKERKDRIVHLNGLIEQREDEKEQLQKELNELRMEIGREIHEISTWRLWHPDYDTLDDFLESLPGLSRATLFSWRKQYETAQLLVRQQHLDIQNDLEVADRVLSKAKDEQTQKEIAKAQTALKKKQPLNQVKLSAPTIDLFNKHKAKTIDGNTVEEFKELPWGKANLIATDIQRSPSKALSIISHAKVTSRDELYQSTKPIKIHCKGDHREVVYNVATVLKEIQEALDQGRYGDARNLCSGKDSQLFTGMKQLANYTIQATKKD
jgi:hypothetical protein